MDLIGKDYILDHVIEDYRNRSENEARFNFLSEILRSLNNSVVKAFGGTEYGKSFEQIKNYKPETRTGEEVKKHVLDKVQKLKERWDEYGLDGDIR